MKLPRPRFTVRRIMVAVAIVGIVLGIMIERQNRFRTVAAHHLAELEKVSRMPIIMSDDPVMFRLEWRESMGLKYERAVREAHLGLMIPARWARRWTLNDNCHISEVFL